MFKICRHQLRMAFVSPRFYIALFMGCAIQIIGILPLFEYAAGVGRPLGILEGFVYFSCERYTISAVFLSIVFLVSDIPFSSENETYTLLRVSRRKWLAGKVLYLFCACSLYYLVVLLAGMAFLSGSAYAGNFWSEPLYYLARGMDTGEYSAYFPYPHVLLLSPLQAVFIAFLLNVAYGFTMSLFLSKYYARYSLLGNSLLMYHSVHGEYGELFPSFLQSFLVFGAAIVILVILIFKGIQRYDFRITVGTKG